VAQVIAFMADHTDDFGVEPMCRALQIAPSTWHAHAAAKADPDRRSKRAKDDDVWKGRIRAVFDANFGVYGVRKVWRQMKRENHDIARSTVARLMRAMGLRGVIRGKPVTTTVQDKKQPCRTLEGLWTLIGERVDLVTPAEAMNYFVSCGYDPE
jgi:putative transposase